MISENYEKKFNVLAVASITENCLLGDANEVFEFCSFITGEQVDLSNLYRFANTIKELIYEQYPEFMNIKVNPMEDLVINPDELKMIKKSLKKGNKIDDLDEKNQKEIYKYNRLDDIKNYYIENFGKKITIKSVKKGIVKVLKPTR